MTPNLLEYFPNSVTQICNEHGSRYEISKCRCDSWFCSDCCQVKGYNLRTRLIPILETFNSLIMISLTVDPELFPDPKTAYLYTMDKRCISVTTQDLHRWNYLFTRRYFYVVEWQHKTEQAHYHILYDSAYIPWDQLLKSWSKHRPKTAEPPRVNRPLFGTVIFSAPKFANPVHAARYATKYLIKAPEHGFPEWILAMGKDRRVRRYSTSKGFWGTPPKLKSETQKTRNNKKLSYRERISKCGNSIHVFEMNEFLDLETGEIQVKRLWLGQMGIHSSILDRLFDPGNPQRKRRSLLARSLPEAVRILEVASGQKPQWIRRRLVRTGK